MSKVSRGEQGELKVKNILSGIQEYHHLFNDVTIKNEKSEMTHQVDHILVNSHGVIVIETKNFYETIHYDPKTKAWSKRVKGKDVRIKSPVSQNKSHVKNLKKILKQKVDITSVVVFAKNNAPYIEDENVINLNDLKDFLETYAFEHTYDTNEIDQIAKTIKDNIVDVSRDEHVENIRLYKMVKEEQETMKKYALENGKCPMCEKPIYHKKNSYYCKNCGYNFKL